MTKKNETNGLCCPHAVGEVGPKGEPGIPGPDFTSGKPNPLRGDAGPEDKSVRTFNSGAIRDSDSNKESYVETISWTAFKRFAQYMTSKKTRYGAGNFKKGIPIESYEESLVRHLQKYLENKYEEGTVECFDDHLSGIVFNCFGIMHEEGRLKKNAARRNS